MDNSKLETLAHQAKLTAANDSLLPEITLFGQNADRIFQKKQHVLIGVSPFNSYFTEENLTQLVRWGFETFQQVNIFLPDEISVFTLMALGYPKEKAIYKTRRQDRYLKNKLFRAFKRIGKDEEDAEHSLITITKLLDNPTYCEHYQRCMNRFENDVEFQNGCLSTSYWMLTKHLRLSTTLGDEEVKLATQYFLQEMPLLLDTPRILGVQSSIFMYHLIPEFIEKIYSDNQMLSQEQGYLKMQFKEKSS